MDNINKAAAAGVIFFMVILAGFVAIKIDQPTIAILGGALIGVVIAIPTTALILIIGTKREPEPPTISDWQPPQGAPAFHQMPPHETHNHYYDNRRVVVVNMPANTRESEQRFIVARELRVTPMQAKHMIEAGEVKCLPAGR